VPPRKPKITGTNQSWSVSSGSARAEHKWIRGFLAGSGIYVVAPNFLNILQFFSCKSIKN